MFFVSKRIRAMFASFLIALCSSPSLVVAQQFGPGTPKAPLHVFYADPIYGSMNGDGSKSRPWSTLQAVVAAGLINGRSQASGAVHAGDLIYLLNGEHGSINLYAGNYVNTDFITIQAAPGHHPVMNTLYLTHCSKWVVKGIIFQNPAVLTQRISLVGATQSDNIIIDGNTVYSEKDVSHWTAADWGAKSVLTGIVFNQAYSYRISNNFIKNVECGIYIGGSDILVSHNVIDYFANDGIEFSAHNSIISHNKITNHYPGWNDTYHHDGMQGWTYYQDTSTANVVIDSNLVVASTGDYPTIPAPTGINDDYFQGISIFNGTWSKLTVTNNVVICSATSGLTLYSCHDSEISNNTVIAQNPNFKTAMFVRDSAGGPVFNNVIRNNIANDYGIPNSDRNTCDHNLALTKPWQSWEQNILVADPLKVFVAYDPPHFIFNLKLATASPAIGAGIPSNAPAVDILGLKRNPAKMDLGAYSYTGP